MIDPDFIRVLGQSIDRPAQREELSGVAEALWDTQVLISGGMLSLNDLAWKLRRIAAVAADAAIRVGEWDAGEQERPCGPPEVAG